MKRQTRREFLKTLGAMAGSAGVLSALPAGICHGQAASEAQDRPNILFIMTDDHASQAMSCYGSKINKTPNLDRLANEGMRFTNCFCTNSICAPSRAVILTGKYSHLNGLIDNAATVRRVAADLPQAAPEGRLPDGHHRQVAPRDRSDRLRLLEHPARPGGYYNPAMIEMGQQKKHTGYVTDIITDHALDWLKSGERTTSHSS